MHTITTCMAYGAQQPYESHNAHPLPARAASRRWIDFTSILRLLHAHHVMAYQKPAIITVNVFDAEIARVLVNDHVRDLAYIYKAQRNADCGRDSSDTLPLSRYPKPVILSSHPFNPRRRQSCVRKPCNLFPSAARSMMIHSGCSASVTPC